MFEMQKSAEESNNLLYMLHSTPLVGYISLTAVSKETSADDKLQNIKHV